MPFNGVSVPHLFSVCHVSFPPISYASTGGRGAAYTGVDVSIAYCTDVGPKPVYAACYSKRLLLQMFLPLCPPVFCPSLIHEQIAVIFSFFPLQRTKSHASPLDFLYLFLSSSSFRHMAFSPSSLFGQMFSLD